MSVLISLIPLMRSVADAVVIVWLARQQWELHVSHVTQALQTSIWNQVLVWVHAGLDFTLIRAIFVKHAQEPWTVSHAHTTRQLEQSNARAALHQKEFTSLETTLVRTVQPSATNFSVLQIVCPVQPHVMGVLSQLLSALHVLLGCSTLLLILHV